MTSKKKSQFLKMFDSDKTIKLKKFFDLDKISKTYS